jgi:hypothetical protein
MMGLTMSEPRARDVARVVLAVEGNWYLRPVKALWQRPTHHVDPSQQVLRGLKGRDGELEEGE